MEIGLDFLEWLGPDASSSVLVLLDDPKDLVHVSAVSRSWRRFVIANCFCKRLCSRMFPEVSNFTRVVETSSLLASVAGSSSSAEWKSLEREHRVYSYLSQSIASIVGKRECILESIRASSTDNFPDESIENTLEPSDQVDMRPSYWSSEGRRNPDVSETLTYRLFSKLCVINEIVIQPFEAYFQPGNPIYSAKTVRFRMGHSRWPLETSTAKEGQTTADDNYEWTYVSPEFPMLQENTLQSFKLPRAALCIGGILQVELLGRVQVQEMDGLYYICVCHVEAIGHPLTPQLDTDIVEGGQEMVLRCQLEARGFPSAEKEPHDFSGWHAFRERIRHLRAGRAWHHPILNTLLGAAESDSDDEALF